MASIVNSLAVTLNNKLCYECYLIMNNNFILTIDTMSFIILNIIHFIKLIILIHYIKYYKMII